MRDSSSAKALLLSAYWRAWISPPEDQGAHHPDDVDKDDVQDHGLRGRGSHADRAACGGVAVVATDEHDRRRHEHALDDAEYEVGRVLEHPEDQEVPAGT